jgi:fructuronate reductase
MGFERRLSDATLGARSAGTSLFGYDREAIGIGIVHLGPGAFHRAHQASYVDALLHRDPRWGISEVALKSASVRDALAPQQGLYTLAELGESRTFRILGAIRELLVASEAPDAVFARLVAPTTRIVTLTVTEKGYCLGADNKLDHAHAEIEHDLRTPNRPRSVIGWLVEALRRRRAVAVPPFTIVSCDNLTDNGPTLHRALVDFARTLDADLARWIDAEVVCPRTMVDSITPATDDTLRESVAAATGLLDAWPVQREPFKQWVVEEVPEMRAAAWESVGVQLVSDVRLHERAKLRLLNGAHSTLAYAGLLRGQETVLDAMNDPELATFVERMMREDIASSLASSRELDLHGYIDAVLGRFRNPGIVHRLSQIAWDGSRKLRVRIVGTIEDAVQTGRPLDRLAVPIAAWMRFVVRQAKAGAPIVDPDAERLAELGCACTGDPKHDVDLFVTMEATLPRTLTNVPSVREALESAYATI